MGKNTWSRPDREALNRVLANNKSNLEGIVLRLAWKQGLSREEIRQLTWNDVSFSSGQLILPDRLIPMEAETQACLQERYDFRGGVSPFVVISERCRRQILPESVSRLARGALDQEGLKDVSLSDLRRDFIICQLEEHDWPYVARISGVSAPTLYAKFSPYMSSKKGGGGAETATAPQVDEFRLWKVLQAEGSSPVGLTLWLAWKMGVQVCDIISLTWDQVDFEKDVLHLKDRDVPFNSTVRRLLQETRERARDIPDRHVLLTPKSQKPIDQPRLSKMVRTALIRGGMEDVTLRDLNREEKHGREDGLLLRYAAEKGSVTRREAMDILGLQKVASYERLRRLTEQRKLVRVGSKYYLTGTVVPPEEQYEVIRKHLERVDGAYRQELAELSHVKARQCTLMLKHMVEDGKLIQIGQRYFLPSEEPASHLS